MRVKQRKLYARKNHKKKPMKERKRKNRQHQNDIKVWQKYAYFRPKMRKNRYIYNLFEDITNINSPWYAGRYFITTRINQK